MPYSYTSYFKLFFELSNKKYAVIANFFVLLQNNNNNLVI